MTDNNDIYECADLGCDKPGTVRTYGTMQLPLCDEHMWDMAASKRSVARELITKLDKAGALAGHTDGWTYVIRLANGNVKIGTTVNPTMKRLKDLTSKTNHGIPVQILSIAKGGLSREMLAHSRWFSLRVPGSMEEFYPDPSLLDWAKEQGIDPEVGEDVLNEWAERKHGRGDNGLAAQEMWNYTKESQ